MQLIQPHLGNLTTIARFHSTVGIIIVININHHMYGKAAARKARTRRGQLVTSSPNVIGGRNIKKFSLMNP